MDLLAFESARLQNLATRMNHFGRIQWTPVYSLTVPCFPISYCANFHDECLRPPISQQLRTRFANCHEFVQSLLTRLEAEHGVCYYTAPSTFSGDFYG